VDRSYITWDPDVIRFKDVARSRHPLLRGKGFYAILSATLDDEHDVWHDLELMFIGKAFDQSLRARIPQPRAAYDRMQAAMTDQPGRELIVMLGEQTESTLKRVTRGFTEDVERCLVVRHRPPINRPPSGAYRGRKISVVNRGDFAPLKPKCLLRPDVE